MSRSNNLVSWIFGRQMFGHAPSDISDITDIVMSTFEVEFTLSSNIEEEIIQARMGIPDYDLLRVTAKPTITLMSITCLGRLKLIDALKRFMDTNFARFKIFFYLAFQPGELSNYFLLARNKDVLSEFQSTLFNALAKENFEIGSQFHPRKWDARCPIAEKVPRGKGRSALRLQIPFEVFVRGIRLLQVLPDRKEIMTIDSMVRVDRRDISGCARCDDYMPRGEYWQRYSRFYT